MAVKNPFAEWQNSRQQRREQIVRQYLTYLKTKRVRCEYITDLAEMVAVHIAEQECKTCNRATLLRNKRYRLLLLSFMAQSSASGASAIDRSQITDPKANAVILSTELAAENLRREIARLKAYITQLEKTQSSQREPDSTPHAAALEQTNQLRKEFSATCQALLAVMKHFEGLLIVDSDTERLMDAASRPLKVVVDKKLVSPFFQWLRANRNVGGVA